MFDLRGPIGQQRRRRNQQAGATRLMIFWLPAPSAAPRCFACRAFLLRAACVASLSEDQQQRQHLHRLAEAHVISEARAQAEAGEQMQPPHAGLLIGS